MGTKLPRVTAKIFASNAAADDIGQFGSALAGTKVLTSDIAQIQSLPAYVTGWRGAVLSTRNYPTLQEMNGLQKTFSQQIAYLLESGIPEYDAGTTYYVNEFCRVGAVLYYSLTDDNLDNNPVSDTVNWAQYNPGAGNYANPDLSNLTAIGEAHFANPDLSNLSSDGNAYINNSKSLETGDVSDNAVIYPWIEEMYHSTFDLSKFTVTGTTGLTDDGIIPAGIYGSANKVECNYLIPLQNNEPWEINTPLYEIDTTVRDNSDHYMLRYLQGFYYEPAQANRDAGIALNGRYGTTNITYVFSAFYGTGAANANTITVTTDYPTAPIQFKIKYTGTQFELYSRLNGFGAWTLLGTKSQTSNFTHTLTNKMTISHFDSATWTFKGSTDLKYMSIINNGVLAFSCNQTSTDTYTVNGSTVSIPYTLSNTGSKIADAAYRSQVTALYNAQGYAPYYTIDEAAQTFSLPAGEIYGMISKTADNTRTKTLTALQPDYANAIDYTVNTNSHTAPSDGWVIVDVLNQSHNATFQINTVAVCWAYWTTYIDKMAGCFPVKKGDTFEISAMSGTSASNIYKFVPQKGV